jgi:hypothetical protein
LNSGTGLDRCPGREGCHSAARKRGSRLPGCSVSKIGAIAFPWKDRKAMNQRYPRRPRRWRKHPFDDLSPRDEATAWMLVNRWRAQRYGNVPPWLYSKLIERAYKLVEDPSTPYRLAGAAGGRACARRHPGKEHPIHRTRARCSTDARERTKNGNERDSACLQKPDTSCWTSDSCPSQEYARSGAFTKAISVLRSEVNKELSLWQYRACRAPESNWPDKPFQLAEACWKMSRPTP